MRYFVDLVLHFLNSNSRHGTHSPFVYQMADKVIYNVGTDDVSYEGEDKSDRLINEICAYYSLNESNSVIVDVTSINHEDLIRLQDEFSFVFVKNIYSAKDSKKKWSAWVADQRIIVTIDLFYFGIVLFRSQQPKENFKLRFPFFKC